MTRRFIVEHEQNADFTNQNFSIKSGQHRLSVRPTATAHTHSHTEPNLPSHNKRHRTDTYGLKTSLIESISWQWLYATNLLVTHEVILTTRDMPLSSSHYSWLPFEVVIAVGWLLKNYWNPDSLLFNPTEQQDVSQNHPFAITAMMTASEHNPPQYQPTESNGQQAPGANSQLTGSFINPVHSDSGDGKEDPQAHRHTLDLNCFVYPCHGICRFRSSSDNAHSISAEATCTDSAQQLNDDVAMPGHSPVKSDDLVIINWLINLGNHGLVEAPGKVILTRSNPKTSKTGAVKCSGASPTGYLAFDGASHCGKTRLNQKREDRAGQITCVETLLLEDGQQRLCWKVCKNAQTLADHKSKNHTGQQTCDVSVVSKDNKQRTCGLICKSVQNLLYHKRRDHTGQQTCDMTVIAEDGQLRPCGMVLKNAPLLSAHKNGYHTRQRICGETVVLEDSEQRPCGKLCKNTIALTEHKRREHSGQKTCYITVVGKDGQQRQCGKICKSAAALSTHKSSIHSGQKTCYETLNGKDGQQRPCGKVFSNAGALYEHKRVHRKRKPVNLDQNDDICP
ncbi:hypothetical protein [Endozoicomonas sp. 8E]|uniref:hypothetical protein n=1 Tax=Endozoicomonas sp. 8E TaxID=3035692 RepID=UPI0029391797|nr:hypothetical protein [Endozoicomonas sp. 8E]WOG26955.1 hypothetical protein P6910_20755 [Endozoicomonas sp. 8E]